MTFPHGDTIPKNATDVTWAARCHRVALHLKPGQPAELSEAKVLTFICLAWASCSFDRFRRAQPRNVTYACVFEKGRPGASED